MAINTVAFAKKYTQTIDRAVTQGSVTGFLEDSAMAMRFHGADTVYVPSFEFVGLGNYDRDAGYPMAGSTVKFIPYTLPMERGRLLQIDAQDADETGIPDLIGQMSSEYVRTQVVPEIDAYNQSALSTAAMSATGQNASIAAVTAGSMIATPYAKFTAAANAIYAELGFDAELVAFCSPLFMASLESSTEIDRSITVSDFKHGGVNLKVKKLNEIALRPMSQSRMWSAYTFNAGATSAAGGFTPATAGRKVHLLMVARKAAQFVKKVNKTHLWAPNIGGEIDAWRWGVRLYFGMLIRDSWKKGIYCLYELPTS